MQTPIDASKLMKSVNDLCAEKEMQLRNLPSNAPAKRRAYIRMEIENWGRTLGELKAGEKQMQYPIDVSELKKLVDGILSDLNKAKQSILIPDGAQYYWEIQAPERYGSAEPQASLINQGDLDSDWTTARKLRPDAELRVKLSMLVPLSNLLRAIGDNHPAWVP
jgi:hypothetical protein